MFSAIRIGFLIFCLAAGFSLLSGFTSNGWDTVDPVLTPQPALTSQPAAAVPVPSRAPTAAVFSSPSPSLPGKTATKTAEIHSRLPLPSSTLLPLHGQVQALPLSCESRSAVDWAAHYGVKIDEIEFQNRLPRSDNPEVGFVGDVNGVWGKLPPFSYGVHAAPVAEILRDYGLNARAVSGLTLEELKIEIASGRPVIVWVVGHIENSEPVLYTAVDGQQVTVARKEHTVIAVGYTGETITVLDGNWIYGRANTHFINSWGVLGNKAVILSPDNTIPYKAVPGE